MLIGIIFDTGSKAMKNHNMQNIISFDFLYLIAVKIKRINKDIESITEGSKIDSDTGIS